MTHDNQTEENAKIMISETGEIHGRGSDKYKWVSNLTPAERDHVKNGGLVLIPDGNNNPTCTPYKQVVYGPYGYRHKNYYGQVETNNQ